MQNRICRPSELSNKQKERWRSLVQSHKSLQHPQLTFEWAEIIESAGWPVEIVEFQEDNSSGFFPFARYTPTQAGPIGGHFSDRQAIMASPTATIDPLKLIRLCQINRYHFDHVAVENFWVSQFPHETDSAFKIILKSTFADYWEQLQIRCRSWCQQIQRKQRKLTREVGPLRFEFHTDSNEAWQALIEWKQKQVVDAGLLDVFSDDRSRRLMLQTVKHQSSNFAGMLSALYAGSQLVAVHLGQRSGDNFNAWIPSYHPEFSSYSPGVILHLELLSRAVNEGIVEIDLGRGTNPLKQNLATETTDLAIGAIDSRPWSGITDYVKLRLKTGMRKWKGSAPLIKFYRQIRNKRNVH